MRIALFISILAIGLASCKKDEDQIESDSTPSVQTPAIELEATYDVMVEEAVVYAEGLSHDDWNTPDPQIMELVLDVYTPDNNSQNRPAIVLFHGGGFNSGSRLDPNIINMAQHFASRGWVAFSVDYRLREDRGTIPQSWIDYAEVAISDEDLRDEIYKMYPAHRDAKAAMRWVIANASEYGINTDYLTVGGGSAGCIISIALAVTNEEDYVLEISEEIDPTLATTNLGQSYTVQTIIDHWGNDAGCDVLGVIDGVDRFNVGEAPIIIFHGTEDSTVPFSDAEELVAQYEAIGSNYAFYPLEGYDHAAWSATIEGQEMVEVAFDFVVEQQGL